MASGLNRRRSHLNPAPPELRRAAAADRAEKRAENAGLA
jgi:hypothetical protein